MESDDDCYYDKLQNVKNQNVNYGWPEEAHYMPVLPNARNISIREQPIPMRRMIRATVSHVTNSILFDSAFPSAEKAEFEIYHRDALIRCAKHLKYSELVKRLQRDDDLVKLCARVVSILIISQFFLIC
jgi:hypothetical protein